MVLSVFMLRMKNELTSLHATLINDIEDASPNTKSKLQEIYPISFKMDLKGHKDIYVCLDASTKNITFSASSQKTPVLQRCRTMREVKT